MATTTWFAGDESCARGYVREDHVVVRLWSDERGATLRRATCLPSSGRAESWLQKLLAGETGRRLLHGEGPVRARHWPLGTAGTVLAEEVASAVDRVQPWRDWADWLWRQGDARGTRIELGEALAAARGTAREAVLEAEIAELERVNRWASQREALIQASANRQRPGEARPKLRLEHGQLIGFHGAPAFGQEFAAYLCSLAELRTCVHDRPSFEQLVEALGGAALGGVSSLTIDLERALNPEQGAQLIDAIHCGLPRLRTLIIRSRTSRAGMLVGEPLVQALQRLLGRQREPLHWDGLVELELPLDVPADGWDPFAADGLCAALGRSAIERLRMSAQHWPTSLTRWLRASGFEDRLSECRLTELRGEAPPPSRPVAVPVAVPKLANVDDRANLTVWADWLSSHGDPLGELTLLLASEESTAAIRERIAMLEAELASRLSAGRPEALRLTWEGPLLERIEVFGERCPWPVELVERVLASPAASALGQLRITGLDSASIRQVLERIASERPMLKRLELDGRVPIAAVLESLPELRELEIGEPDPSALPTHRHAQLRQLRLVVPVDWTMRYVGRLFSRLRRETLPGLTRLTLDVEHGRGGGPIPFERLQLPDPLVLRVLGRLRRSDYDMLRRWARYNPNQTFQLEPS